MWISFGQVSIVWRYWRLGYWFSDEFFGYSSGFGSIIGLGIFYFGQVVFKVLDGFRVELYASGGASFTCWYKL